MQFSFSSTGARVIGGALLAGAVLSPLAHAQRSQATSAFPDSVSSLFKSLAGHWSCVGDFARGGALAADLTFAPALGDFAIEFQHADRAPGTYWQNSTWAFDGKTGRIVSSGRSGSEKDRTGAASMFTASAWSPTSVTLEAETIKAPPFAPNRFVYSLHHGSTLKMRWELGRNGTWALGDSLVCSRG